ncbi:stalk domain-containing protein [Paenibacillus germinis]|uniref:stalk domain-containing protein n=1 Tax=Paenibacillus germinis TaxID=2654979 RepID=UPI0035E3FE3F
MCRCSIYGQQEGANYHQEKDEEFRVGKDVTWDGETQTLTESKGSSKINLKIDSNEAFIVVAAFN